MQNKPYGENIYILCKYTFLWVFVCIKFRAYACIYGNAMMGNKQPATWKLLDLLDLKIENICYVFISFYETMYFSWMAFFLCFASLFSFFFCVLLLLSFLLFLWIDTIAIEPYGSCCLVAVSLFFLHLIRFSLTVRTVKCATTKQRQNKYLAWILVGSTFYSWPKVNPVVDTANFMNRNVKCDQEGSTVCKTIRKRKLKEEHSYCYFCFGFVACVSPSTKL